MTTNDDETGANAPDDTPIDGASPDAIYRGPAPQDSAALGSVIGSEFDSPTEPLLPVPPPPPPASAPTTPSVAPPTGASPEQPPGQNTPWGETLGASSAPASPTSPTPPPAPAPLTSPAGVGYTTPAESVQYPVAEPTFGNDSGGSSKLPWIFAVVAAVILLGGGAFFAASAFGASGGAASPDEGIEAVLGAVGEEDFVTLAELMDPSERRTIAEPAITELLPELVRLGVLDDSVDAGDVDGVDLVFTDVEYRVERLVGVDDIAHVFLTGGEIATNVNSASLPFTDEVDTTDFDQQDRQTITETETPIVFVERDGDWYFSLLFTIAENARIAADERLPGVDESPAQIPSDSPEAAIEGMFNSLTSFDLSSLVGHMDPEEMAVLYRYAPLFLDEAQEALDDIQGDLRDEGVTWEMTDFDFDVDQNGDDAVVTMRGFVVNFAVDGVELSATYSRDELSGELNVDGISGALTATTTDYDIAGQVEGSAFEANVSIEPESNRISGTVGIEGDSFDGELVLDPAGECSRFEITGSEGTNESGCLEDEAGIDGLGPLLEAMEDWPEEFPGVSMRARQVDGGWFVSPIGSIFDGVITSLEGLEEGDFDEVFDPFAGIAGDAAADPFGILDGETDLVDPAPDEVFDTFSDPVFEGDTSISVSDGEVATFSGDIGENGFDTYSIDLEAGATVVVTAQRDGSTLDTTLRVTDASGNQIAFNDDASPIADLPNGLDSQVIFTAPDTGIHVFEVAAFGSTDSGAYLLTVDRASDGIVDNEGEVVDEVDPIDEVPLPADTIGIDVAPGDSVIVGGEVVAPATYSIDLSAGDALVITVESDDPAALDPIVSLLLDGVEIGRNDDADDSTAVADSFDSQLFVTADDSGTHTILVEGFAGTTGGFTMSIDRN